jgi:hypothetical protein
MRNRRAAVVLAECCRIWPSSSQPLAWVSSSATGMEVAELVKRSAVFRI